MLTASNKLLNYIDQSISRTLSGSRKIGIARTIIALGQLSILAFTQWDALFIPVNAGEFGPKCSGIGKVGAYCLLSDKFDIALPSVLLIIGLVFVISGFLPRISGLIHLWITLSISTAVKLPDGGESIAQIVVFFLAVILVSDSRFNHWQEDSNKPSAFLPVSWAASQLLRLQLVWIYINAAVTKTSVPEWKDGTAVYYTSLDPQFGVSGPLAPIFSWAVEIPLITLLMTWGAIVTEMVIAFILLSPSRFRAAAFWVAVLLHGSFILMIGLWSFALVMVGSVLAATGSSVYIRNIFILPKRL